MASTPATPAAPHTPTAGAVAGPPTPTAGPGAPTPTGAAAPAKRKRTYNTEINSMMYQYGDVKTPLAETSDLVEQLVRQHVIDVARQTFSLAQKRGSRPTTDDILFVLRRDREKVNRVRDYLAARKQIKTESTTSATANSADDLMSALTGDERKRGRLKRAKLQHDLLSSLYDSDADSEGGLDEKEIEAETRRKLKVADEITRSMDPDNYMYYTDCKQQSFTQKKAKKFREWTDVAVSDLRANDEMLEVLGFLAREAVGMITQTAVTLKASSTIPTPLHPWHIREAVRRLRKRSSSVLDTANGSSERLFFKF